MKTLCKVLVAALLACTLCVSASAAVKPWCYFVLGVVGDGTTTTQVFNLNTDPFVLASPFAPPTDSYFVGSTAGTFSSLTPTGVEIDSTDGPTISSISLGLGGNVTIVWSSAIANGTPVRVTGKIIF